MTSTTLKARINNPKALLQNSKALQASLTMVSRNLRGSRYYTGCYTYSDERVKCNR